MSGSGARIGNRGTIGPTGPTGPEGPRGKTGKEGDDGKRGKRGYPGVTGATGPQGLIGPAGATGTAINEYAFFYNDVEVTIPVTTEVTTLPLSSKNGIVFGNFTHITGQEAIIINQIGNYNVHWNVTLPSVTSTTNFVIGLRLGVTDLPGSFVGVTTTPGENTLLSGQFILNVPFPEE